MAIDVPKYDLNHFNKLDLSGLEVILKIPNRFGLLGTKFIIFNLLLVFLRRVYTVDVCLFALLVP